MKGYLTRFKRLFSPLDFINPGLFNFRINFVLNALRLIISQSRFIFIV